MSEIDRMYAQVKRLSVTIEELESKIERFKSGQVDSSVLNHSGLHSSLVMAMLTDECDAGKLGFQDRLITVLGDGFLGRVAFEEFLEDKGFSLTDLDTEHDVLVVGSQNIREKDIDSELNWAVSNDIDLLVLSQELFVVYLVTGSNPLEIWSIDTLLQHADEHKGLSLVLNWEGEFPWPQVSSHRSQKEILEFTSQDFADESPLHRSGYNASEGKLTTSERRGLLRGMFTEENPESFKTKRELKLWGKARTHQRLYAIAKHISWLRNLRKSSAPRAVEKWDSDLEWLKKSYYVSSMRFDWPGEGSLSSNEKSSKKPVQRALEPKISADYQKKIASERARMMTSSLAAIRFDSSQPVGQKQYFFTPPPIKPSGQQVSPGPTSINYVDHSSYTDFFPNRFSEVGFSSLKPRLWSQTPNRKFIFKKTGARVGESVLTRSLGAKSGWAVSGAISSPDGISINYIEDTDIEVAVPHGSDSSIVSCPYCKIGAVVPPSKLLRVTCRCTKVFFVAS